MTQITKQDETKKGVSPVAAAVTGAVIGAGVAVAGAMVLKDEKNREKVKQVLTKVKDQAMGYMDDAKKQAQDKKDEVEKTIIEGREATKKLASTAKTAHHTLN